MEVGSGCAVLGQIWGLGFLRIAPIGAIFSELHHFAFVQHYHSFIQTPRLYYIGEPVSLIGLENQDYDSLLEFMGVNHEW